ncbi:MAG: hypothetical protein E6Q96_03345 [Cyclobacteriaceae bacterium]|nr:hypothetical protein [Ferruginibacter sp.]TXH29550.1 MAG: hypothetical protein E6Q96_03345 [Cyclobacteriaceae bacterium]HQR01648.1 hypothetical protein [Ferruginibacter sp.]
MLTDEIKKRVRKDLRSGVPEGELKNQLAEEGYAEADIKELFRPHKYDMRSWYLSFAVIFLLAGIYWVMRYGGIKLLLLSGAMVSAYFLEKKRLEKNSA